MSERTLKIPHSTLVDLIVSHLYATSYLNDNEDVIDFDMALPIDENGMVEFDIETVNLRATRTAPKLSLV